MRTWYGLELGSPLRDLESRVFDSLGTLGAGHCNASSSISRFSGGENSYETIATPFIPLTVCTLRNSQLRTGLTGGVGNSGSSTVKLTYVAARLYMVESIVIDGSEKGIIAEISRTLGLGTPIELQVSIVDRHPVVTRHPAILWHDDGTAIIVYHGERVHVTILDLTQVPILERMEAERRTERPRKIWIQ